jgi:pilus assembly protein Flp/PilA
MSAPTGFPPDATGPRIARARWRRLRADRKGSAAIEFGIVAFPFLTLLFAILETALVFWSTQVLETAVANASRTIYTGQFQASQAGMTPEQIAAAFKDSLCDNVGALFPCEGSSGIHIGVLKMGPDTTPEAPVVDGEINEDAFKYETTAANDIVLVRVALEYPVFLSMLSSGQTLNNGKRLIMSSATFRNEPF